MWLCITDVCVCVYASVWVFMCVLCIDVCAWVCVCALYADVGGSTEENKGECTSVYLSGECVAVIHSKAQPFHSITFKVLSGTGGRRGNRPTLKSFRPARGWTILWQQQGWVWSPHIVRLVAPATVHRDQKWGFRDTHDYLLCDHRRPAKHSTGEGLTSCSSPKPLSYPPRQAHRPTGATYSHLQKVPEWVQCPGPGRLWNNNLSPNQRGTFQSMTFIG